MKRSLFVLATAALGSLSIVTLAEYGSLPNPMPVHFDLAGRADGWGSPLVGAWLLPAVSAGVLGASRFFPHEPKREAAEITALFLVALQALVLRAALSGTGELGGFFPLVLGSFQIALGLWFPRLRRNRWIGIRVPWTLGSDENWARTHRFGGALFVTSGLLALLFAVLAPVYVATGVALVALLAASLVATVYSYRLAH